MRYFVLSVYDRAACAYGRPVFALSIGAAIRSFQDEINRVSQDNSMNGHAKDFDLFHVGEFHDDSGTFEGGPPALVAVGAQLLLPLEAA